jgi:mono/diheme cytochrome c family protein
MKPLRWIILVPALLLAGCEKPGAWLPPPGFIGDPEQGRVLFASRCASCHGADARGTDQGPPLVHEIYRPGHHADIAFHLAVKNGVRAHHWGYGDMPPQPGLTPEQVGHMVEWVRREQRRAGIE